MNDMKPTSDAPATSVAPAPQGFWHRVADLYIDGFRSMTVGRKLWLLIIIKLIFIFGIMKLFFFPNLLSRDYDSDAERADAVRHALTEPRRHPVP